MLAPPERLFVFLWSLRNRNVPPVDQTLAPSQIAHITVVLISKDSIAREVSSLEQRLEQMETELNAVSRRAALADLKRQTETLLEQYGHW
jgi:hypothetical protein